MTSFGICSVSCAPVHATPSATHPLINELLFGEAFAVLEERGDFWRVRPAHDRYTGWMDRRQGRRLGASDYARLTAKPAPVVVSLMARASSGRRHLLLPRGASLPGLRNGALTWDGERFTVEGHVELPGNGARRKRLAALCESYLDCPYRWGGRSPWGIDCSGLVQVVFKLLGVALPRDAGEQQEQGRAVASLADVRQGDLYFGANVETGEPHVGIVMDGETVIHASGRVRRDRLSAEGILDRESSRLTHRGGDFRRVW